MSVRERQRVRERERKKERKTPFQKRMRIYTISTTPIERTRTGGVVVDSFSPEVSHIISNLNYDRTVQLLASESQVRQGRRWKLEERRYIWTFY